MSLKQICDTVDQEFPAIGMLFGLIYHGSKVRLLFSNYCVLQIPKRNEMYKPDDQIKEDETGEHVARIGRKEMHAGIGKKT